MVSIQTKHKRLNERIAAQRGAQSALARSLGYSQSVLSKRLRLETGFRPLSPDEMQHAQQFMDRWEGK